MLWCGLYCVDVYSCYVVCFIFMWCYSRVSVFDVIFVFQFLVLPLFTSLFICVFLSTDSTVVLYVLSFLFILLCKAVIYPCILCLSLCCICL